MATFIDDLKDLNKKTIEEFDNLDMSNFKEPYLIMDGIMKKSNYQKGTALETFRKEVKGIMDKTGFEYKLSLVGAYETCDGGCYEFAYSLCWYDKGLHHLSFNFATCY